MPTHAKTNMLYRQAQQDSSLWALVDRFSGLVLLVLNSYDFIFKMWHDLTLGYSPNGDDSIPGLSIQQIII